MTQCNDVVNRRNKYKFNAPKYGRVPLDLKDFQKEIISRTRHLARAILSAAEAVQRL
jgi:hypothetical protein